MNKAQKQLASDLRNLASALGRLCDKHAPNVRHVNLQRAWAELEAECSRQEKEHMSFGARLLNRRPPRKSTHATRVYYFMCKAVLPENEKLHEIRSAVDAYTVRRDILIGAAIREALDAVCRENWIDAPDLPAYLRALGNTPLLDALAACDYAEHLA